MGEKLEIERLAGPAPMPGGAFDLARLGYVEEEFLLRGRARSHAQAGERGSDGRWSVRPDQEAPFTTRMIVRRPIDAARFSGTVVVEWNNVSGGIDASPDWTLLHRQIARRGDAWVGVAAQKAGIDGGGFVEGMHLKKMFPDRYGVLDHPGDAWSFDLFSNAGLALRNHSRELGLAAPRQILAMGESQSAMFLITYINAIDPLARGFDGFLVHGRGASGAALDGTPLVRSLNDGVASLGQLAGERVREDARVPVLVLQSETDVALLGGGRPQQPDGARVRLWEIAGSAHADTYLLVAGAHDDGSLAPARFAELLRPTTQLLIGTTDSPINAGPQQHYIGQAALDALARWSAGGAAPASAPRLERSPDGLGFALDAHGNALGGVRTPWVDAPAAKLSGLGQSGSVFAFLFGTTVPFDAAKLASLYPGGRAEYLTRFERALDRAIAAGFVLAADRDEILALAAAAAPL